MGTTTHDKKVALVTGANKGIGLEVGRQLGKLGLTVVLAAREVAKANAAAARLQGEGLDAHGVVLDVTELATAEAAARWLDENFGRLDVLVNNAGINHEFGEDTRPSQLDLGTLKATYETNVFGAFAVIKAMLPLLRKSSSARIINQSSTLGSLGILSDPGGAWYGVNTLAYNSSKSALNGLTLAFAKDLAGDRISVNSVCPGWVKTDMGSDAAHGDVLAVARMDNLGLGMIAHRSLAPRDRLSPSTFPEMRPVATNLSESSPQLTCRATDIGLGSPSKCRVVLRTEPAPILSDGGGFVGGRIDRQARVSLLIGGKFVEAVVYIGLQGAGKSTFYRERFFHSHVRLSLDMLKTRHRERRLLRACVEALQPFVVDNTNPTPSERQVYIRAAREAGFRVVGYYFRSRVEDCLRRNERRPAGQRVPPKGVLGTAGRMVLPSISEGFDGLHYVRIDEDGAFVVEGWRDEDR